MLIIFLLLPLTLAFDPHLLSDEYIERINTKQSSWKAGRNFPEDTPLEHLSSLFGAIRSVIPKAYPIKTHDPDLIASLPESFDPREKWTNCPSLNEIRDQGPCGSCWAFGAVEAMTDRWCIHFGSQFHFSAQDVTGCDTKDSHGCFGGDPWQAWEFWNTDGIVSGGNFNSKQGCRPYEIPECIHGKNCSGGNVAYCVKECQEGYDTSYENDKKFGTKPYLLDGEDNIKAELFKYGPLEVSFIACPDLYHYKSGVYKCTMDTSECKGHAVKLLGWGIENDTKYWLLANSWNTYWGELGGFFKFLRGENHLGIEDVVTGGMPKNSDDINK
ncbi:cathepsin B-like [Plodia interpunctella]|uniref:cathepsin B-like n=1 Tax=Plodia interpunctella TaxID=58824 RepID=UPI0023675871|nr:cathepsin B-like [Plodia interpunctella]